MVQLIPSVGVFPGMSRLCHQSEHAWVHHNPYQYSPETEREKNGHVKGRGKSDVCPTKVKIRKEKRVEQHQDKKGQ